MSARSGGIEQKVVESEELAGLIAEAAQLERGRAPAYLEAARRATDFAEQPGIPSGQKLRAQLELANAYRISAHFQLALELLENIISAAADLPEEERSAVLALAHLRTAIVYDVVDAVPEGFQHLEKAQRYYTLLADEPGLATCGLVRGALYSRTGDLLQAANCFEESLAYYRSVDDRSGAASALSNLCVMYRQLDRLDEAIAAGEEASQLAQSLLLRSAALSNLAFALGHAGRLDEAEQKSVEASRLVMELGDQNYINESWRVHASILVWQDRITEARDLLHRVLDAAREHGINRNVSQAHRDLSRVYAQLGDHRLALEHFETYHELAMADIRNRSRQQLELHKWQLELEMARDQARQERDRRKQLAESLAELGAMHEQLSARASQLEWYSHRDALTELANRRYFDERLTREAELSRVSGQSMSLLMLDLDDFKSVNDRYGHLVGDEVLRQAARLLESRTRRSDLCARLGGEEFAVLLASDHDEDELVSVAEDLRAAFEQFDWTAVAAGLKVTISIGAATITEVDHDPLRLLDLADRRLYAAKRAGRNRVVSGQPVRRQRR